LTIRGQADFLNTDVETGGGRTLLKGMTNDYGLLYLDGGRKLENDGTFNTAFTSDRSIIQYNEADRRRRHHQ
jgi:hypothetical protein